MPEATQEALSTAPGTRMAPLRLGFNTRVSFDSGPTGASRGLREGIELFKAAERLGYQSGWTYQRHFDNYLSSPFPAVAEAVALDAGIAAADELILFLPPEFGLEDNVRLLTDMARTVAPALGWVAGR